MSRQTMRLAVDFTIHDGKREAFESLAQAMNGISQKEPGTLAYEWFLSSDGKRCRLIETYLDADAILVHFMGSAVQDFVPKLIETASVTRFEIYGDPGPKVTGMVAGFGVEIFAYWRGLDR